MPRLLSLRGYTPYLLEAANRIGKIALLESLLSFFNARSVEVEGI